MRHCWRAFFPVILPFALLLSSHAQTAGVTLIQLSPNGAIVQIGSVWLRLTAIAPAAFRVRYSHTGKFSENASFAVVAASTNVDVQRHDILGQIVLSTGQLSASVDRATGALTFLDASGQVISQDQSGFPVKFQGEAFRVYKSM